MATATRTIMSRVRALRARTAPSKKIRHEYPITGRLRISWKTSSRMPNGAGTLKCSTWRPIADQSRIGTDSTAATRNLLRMSWTMAFIDISACPPWPITSCGECITMWLPLMKSLYLQGVLLTDGRLHQGQAEDRDKVAAHRGASARHPEDGGGGSVLHRRPDSGQRDPGRTRKRGAPTPGRSHRALRYRGDPVWRRKQEGARTQ